MLSIADDPFLDEFHDHVEQARTDHRAQIKQEERARRERESRARELAQHVTRRFAAVASSNPDPDQGVESVRLDSPDGEDLPATELLHWRVSRPHRTLEIRLSERTGRYWFHLLVMDELSASGRIVEDGHGDVMSLTGDDVDRLIRRLADQQAWQAHRTDSLGAGGQTDVSPTM